MATLNSVCPEDAAIAFLRAINFARQSHQSTRISTSDFNWRLCFEFQKIVSVCFSVFLGCSARWCAF